MSHHCQAVVLCAWPDLFHFLDGKLYVRNAAQVLRLPSDIKLIVFRHHGRISRQIMLDADRQIAVHGEIVRQKGVLRADIRACPEWRKQSVASQRRSRPLSLSRWRHHGA